MVMAAAMGLRAVCPLLARKRRKPAFSVSSGAGARAGQRENEFQAAMGPTSDCQVLGTAQR